MNRSFTHEDYQAWHDEALAKLNQPRPQPPEVQYPEPVLAQIPDQEPEDLVLIGNREEAKGEWSELRERLAGLDCGPVLLEDEETILVAELA